MHIRGQPIFHHEKERKMMTRYQYAVLRAVELIGKGILPRQAWERALEMEDLKGKGCARAAFLGLCSEGIILKCKKGNYSRGCKNKEYAIKGLKYLIENPQDVVLSPNRLWKKANIKKNFVNQTGYQMDIAIVLFINNLYNIKKVRSYNFS